jgi:RNA polymerase sigma factor (sigma-70 family)
MNCALSLAAPAVAAAWPRRRGRLVRFDQPAIKHAMQAGQAAPRTEQDHPLDDLIARVARHQDRGAFAALFEHFAPRVSAYLTRLGADDGSAQELAQEVMLAVWRRAASFNPALASVSTWIFTIARNKRIDRLRRERHPELDPDDPALAPDPAVGADVALDHAETNRRLSRAIGNLPEEQARLLRMAYFEDKSHRAIAAETKLPLGTVKSRIRLALGRLRAALEGE